MRIILTENQFNLLLEASKVDILINKLGLKKEVAEHLHNLTGPFSVWLANKLIEKESEFAFEHMMAAIPSENEDDAREQYKRDKNYRNQWGVNALNRSGIYPHTGTLTSIMDWIRIGLNGNAKPYQNLNFGELYNKAKEWHDSLEIGTDSINYDEQNQIVRDYRNEDGIGFYWVNLETNDSSEECERMGHCGRTNSSNTILSLRENKMLNDKHTVNKSHVTCAVGKEDGMLYQSKGPRNSKPNEKYHPYLIDLILNSTDPEIKGFKSEYGAENDFSLLDLSEEKFKEIYEKKPHIFNQRKLKRRLREVGIDPRGLGVDTDSMIFTLEIDPANVRYYLDDDYRIGRYKLNNGTTVEKYFSEAVLVGDFFDYDTGYYPTLGETLDQIDKVNNQKIVDILSKFALEQELNNEFTTDINSMSLKELIKSYDKDEQVSDALRSAYNDAYISSYHNSAWDALRNALSEYGTVTKFDYQGVEIEINLNEVIEKSGTDEVTLDEMFEECGDDPMCVFDRILGDYYDKPNIGMDRIEVFPDDEDFNTYLGDRLYDIRT